MYNESLLLYTSYHILYVFHTYKKYICMLNIYIFGVDAHIHNTDPHIRCVA